MRISDWSSYGCSSDLGQGIEGRAIIGQVHGQRILPDAKTDRDDFRSTMSENSGDQFVENDDDFGRDVGRGFGAGQEGFDRVQKGRESRPAVGKRAFVIAVHSMWLPACALRPAAGAV